MWFGPASATSARCRSRVSALLPAGIEHQFGRFHTRNFIANHIKRFRIFFRWDNVRTSKSARILTKQGSSPYSKFDSIDGSHRYKEAVPGGYVEYSVRTRHGATVFYFNFDLAREMGLHPLRSPRRAHARALRSTSSTRSASSSSTNGISSTASSFPQAGHPPQQVHGHALSAASAPEQTRQDLGRRARHLERRNPPPRNDLGRLLFRHRRHPPESRRRDRGEATSRPATATSATATAATRWTKAFPPRS